MPKDSTEPTLPASPPAERENPGAPPRLGARGATPPTHAHTRTIALMNQKGGVGKTTTTVNLAAAIAELGRTVLIVDLDPQAHATLHLGIDPASRDLTVYDLLLDPPAPGASGGIDPLDALVCARPNLGLLPASTDLAAAESELATLTDRQLRLTRALEPLRKIYEFVLIDCPPSLGLLTLNALTAAREVLVPMQAHFLALQGVGKLLETVGLVGRAVNPDLRVAGVVLCMHEEATKLGKEVVADIESFFTAAADQAVPWKGARVYRPPVRRNIKLAECPSFGQTIFEYAPGCPGAADYLELGRSLVLEWDEALARRAPAQAAATTPRAPRRPRTPSKPPRAEAPAAPTPTPEPVPPAAAVAPAASATVVVRHAPAHKKAGSGA